MTKSYAGISGRDYDNDRAYETYTKHIVSPAIEVMSAWTLPFTDDKGPVMNELIPRVISIYNTEFSMHNRDEMLSVGILRLCEFVDKKRFVGRRGFKMYITKVARVGMLRHTGVLKLYTSKEVLVPVSTDEFHGSVDGSGAAEARVFIGEIDGYIAKYVMRLCRFAGLEKEVVAYIDSVTKLGHVPTEEFVGGCIGYPIDKLPFFVSYVEMMRRLAKWNLRHM